MSSSNNKPGQSRGNPGPDSLAEILARELFGSDEEITKEAGKSPIPEADILAMLAAVERSHATAERWRLRSAVDDGNPLVDALAGFPVPIELVHPDGKQTLHGRLSIPLSSTRRDNDMWIEPNQDTEQLAAKDLAHRIDAFSLSASDPDDEDTYVEDWDEPEGLLREADLEPSTEGKLWLECPAWPVDRRLVDLFVCGGDDPEPLAVLTVRRGDGGYELTYDTEDRDLLQCESVAIDVRLVPAQGERA